VSLIVEEEVEEEDKHQDLRDKNETHILQLGNQEAPQVEQRVLQPTFSQLSYYEPDNYDHQS
jgi:hypothetical protein